jgi:putative ABC transport system permease protein
MPGLALPGVSQPASTFKGIIGITFLVVGLVVAMFFILLTIEHLPLYGVLKAVGASNGQVATGVVTQAVVVAVSSFAGGLLLALLVGRRLSSTTPFALQASRMVSVGVGVVVVSVLGSLVSLRRVVKVDPVSVIG